MFFLFFHVTYHSGRDQRVPPFNLFRHCETFFRKFFPQRVLLQFFAVLRQNGCWKIPKGPPFSFFGTVRFFSENKNFPHFNFFDILQHIGCLKIPKGPPFQFFGIVRLFENLFFLQRVPPSTATKMLTTSEVSPF